MGDEGKQFMRNMGRVGSISKGWKKGKEKKVCWVSAVCEVPGKAVGGGDFLESFNTTLGSYSHGRSWLSLEDKVLPRARLVLK